MRIGTIRDEHLELQSVEEQSYLVAQMLLFFPPLNTAATTLLFV